MNVRANNIVNENYIVMVVHVYEIIARFLSHRKEIRTLMSSHRSLFV